MKVLGMKFVLVACLAIAASTVGCKSDKKPGGTPGSDGGGSDAQTSGDSGPAKDGGGGGGTDSGPAKDAGGNTPVDSGSDTGVDVGDGGGDAN